MEERSVDFVTIIVEKEKSRKIQDEIKKYYDENKSNFISKELRSAETLLLDAKEYAKKSTVTEEEIKLLYEERKKPFNRTSSKISSSNNCRHRNSCKIDRVQLIIKTFLQLQKRWLILLRKILI